MKTITIMFEIVAKLTDSLIDIGKQVGIAVSDFCFFETMLVDMQSIATAIASQNRTLVIAATGHFFKNAGLKHITLATRNEFLQKVMKLRDSYKESIPREDIVDWYM